MIELTWNHLSLAAFILSAALRLGVAISSP